MINPTTAALAANADRLTMAAAAALLPSFEPDVVTWAEGNFRLSAEYAGSPGLVTLETWQKEVLRAWQVGKITVVAASSQVGKTVIGLIVAAFSARYRQGPARYVSENDSTALDLVKTRIGFMIRDNLSDIRVKAKSGRGSQTSRTFSNGSSLTIVGASKPGSLSSAPVKTLICTEVRGYPVSVGNRALASGDPLSLALARGKSFHQFKAYIESSPGIAGACRLTEALEMGDYRKWHLTCSHCQHSAPVEYDPEPESHSVHFERGKYETAAIACCECGTLWTAAERLDAINSGTFKPTKKAADSNYVSFQYSELESVRSTLPDIVRRVEAAKSSTEQQQAATNTILGRPFDIEKNGGVEIADDMLDQHRQRYNAAQLLPSEVLVVTAGVDVQPDRLEVQVLGHGIGRNRWSLEYKVFSGNPNGESVWQELADFLKSARYKHPLGGTIAIKAACIDSGGSNTQAVYQFCADNLARGRQWFAIKGQPGSKAIARRSANAILRPGSEQKLVLLGVDTLKNTIFDALQSEDAEGRIYFPVEYDSSFFDGLTSEKKVITKDRKGQTVIGFRKARKDARNEPLDTLAYALAAFSLLTPAPDFTAIRTALSATETGDDWGALSNIMATLDGRTIPARGEFPR